MANICGYNNSELVYNLRDYHGNDEVSSIEGTFFVPRSVAMAKYFDMEVLFDSKKFAANILAFSLVRD